MYTAKTYHIRWSKRNYVKCPPPVATHTLTDEEHAIVIAGLPKAHAHTDTETQHCIQHLEHRFDELIVIKKEQ